MAHSRRHPGSPLSAAILASTVIGGQFVAGKTARDALFLTNFEPSSLPFMVIGTAVFSIALVLATTRVLRRRSPASWVPAAFGLAAVLMVVEWGLSVSVPRLGAWTLYLLVSGAGPVLVSGFWLIVSERFDPHTAKRVFGRIGGAATLGGFVAGLGAAAIGTLGHVETLLPLLAILHLACAWGAQRLARFPDARRSVPPGSGAAATVRSGFRALVETPYLRQLAGLVLLGTGGAIFVEQAFMTHVKLAFGDDPALGRFFAFYYAAISLVTFAIQMGGSRRVLERWGLGVATGTPAATLLAGGAAALVAPGLQSLTLLRAGETTMRASVHRAGYELSFTAVPPDDRRAVKSIIDVGFDRLGDIVGAVVVLQLLWIPQPEQTRMLLACAIGSALIAAIIATRLARGYAEALAASLRIRAVELDLTDVEDRTTRTIVLQTLSRPARQMAAPNSAAERPQTAPRARPEVDRDIARLKVLQSGDTEAIRRVLRSDSPLSAALVACVIPLLESDDLSEDCIRALRAVAEERIGELTDALCDPNQPFAVRRRLARVFSVCVSQRAVDGLLLGLDDLRFEVRYQCGRSLLAVVDRNPAVRVDEARIYTLINREVAVHESVWHRRRLIDDAGEDEDRSFLEALVSDRASRSLAHVFTLLAAVLPAEPLRLAFRALHTEDPTLRGTALEYLESVLPDGLRKRLWPFLEDRRQPGRTRRPREETLAGLIQSRESIRMSLEELKRRAVSTPRPE